MHNFAKFILNPILSSTVLSMPTTSAIAPTLEPTKGVPQAVASRQVIGRPSFMLGITMRSIQLYHLGISSFFTSFAYVILILLFAKKGSKAPLPKMKKRALLTAFAMLVKSSGRYCTFFIGKQLKPGVKYYYRVCSKEILYYGGYHKIFGNTAVSPFYSFDAAEEDAESFTALVFNDIHQRKYIFEALHRHVKNIECDFVVFNGDCIDDPKDHNQATEFIKFLTEAVNGSTIPTMFIRGNHEIRNAYSIGLRKHLDYAGGRTYSAFNWGNTRIVVLDCGEDKKDDHREYSGLNDFTSLRQEQVGFLKEELASKAFKKADKRILFHHIPIYGMLGGNLCEPLWRPLLDKAPFDVAFNAHTHCYKFHPSGSCENNYPVFVGGGKSMDNATVFVLQKSKGKLKVKVINTDGDVLKEWEE